MLNVDGTIGLIFGSAGLLFVAFGIGTIIFMVRKVSEQNRILREGLVAEARCLETFMVHNRTSDGRSHSQRRLIIGFRTYDGRDVRAQITSSQPYVAGDIVPVRYLPQRPERALPAGGSPGLGFASCLFGGASVFFICVGLVLAVMGFSMGAFADGSDDGKTTRAPGEHWTRGL